MVRSEWIQIWALPLLAVGNSVLNRASEKRAKQDHQMLKTQLDLMQKDMVRDVKRDTDALTFEINTSKRLENIEQLLETLLKKQ